jgi:redox-sensitive bicupin YhaK (pirin superfamily)
MQLRPVKLINEARPTIEGAGVHLRRAFGFREAPSMDPFLLLDDFSSQNSHDYIMGFPWHPHRGIETVTYMLEGEVQHKDSMGNEGTIGPGDVQWMTTGSGIVHEEMPKQLQSGMRGFQLWVNLPKKDKMMNPRYQEIRSSEIPIVTLEDGATARIVCGEIQGVHGPIKDLMVNPEFIDISIPADGNFTHAIPHDRLACAYIIEGSGSFSESEAIEFRHLVVFGDGDTVTVRAGSDGVRFLLLSGNPLKEPVAWGGPIVMNTEAELQTAFEEYENGTFIKK